MMIYWHISDTELSNSSTGSKQRIFLDQPVQKPCQKVLKKSTTFRYYKKCHKSTNTGTNGVLVTLILALMVS